jgi:hypothetical protein
MGHSRAARRPEGSVVGVCQAAYGRKEVRRRDGLHYRDAGSMDWADVDGGVSIGRRGVIDKNV